MDWEGLRERSIGDVATTFVTEGGATAGGFIGGAFIGRQIQNAVKPDTAIVSLTDKLLAWGGNNAPKLALWWLGRGYRPAGVLGEATNDARKALAGSVVFDTLMRLSHGGKNPATAFLWDWQVLGNGEDSSSGTSGANMQQIIQENSALRNELNKSLQRLAEVQVPTRLVSPDVEERQRKYGIMEQERQRQLQMEPPMIEERERKYGFMSVADASGFNKGTSEGAIAKASGFL